MGWTPAEVRAASLADIMAAHSGFLMARGVDPKRAKKPRPTRAWLMQRIAEDEADQARRRAERGAA